MYGRNIEGRELTFEFAEGFLNDNLLFVDRETDSVWSQLHGKAIAGPLKDTPLPVLPTMQVTCSVLKVKNTNKRCCISTTN